MHPRRMPTPYMPFVVHARKAAVPAALLGFVCPLWIGAAACRSAEPDVAGHPNTATPGSPPAVVDASTAGGEIPVAAPNADQRRADVIDLVEADEFEEAWEVLGELLADRYLAEARFFLAERSPADALIRVDRVLEIAPRHTEGQLLKADGSLMLAELAMARSGSAGLIEGALLDALAYYERAASHEPRAVFGASRAAYLLGDTDQALRWARRGRLLLEEERVQEGEIDPRPQRTLSEAFYAAYVNVRIEEETTGEAEKLYFETEEALASLLGRAPDHPWVWTHFSDLYEWEGRFDLARAKLAAGLLRLPDDPGLLERLMRVTRKESGAEGVIATFGAYVGANPSVALGHWYLALETFDDGLGRLDQADADAFTRSEAGFRRTRELDTALAPVCLGYEVMCRNARGWCAFYADDLETATREFLSTNEVFERGIEWKIEGKLQDGIIGLAFVGDQYNNREDWLGAGSIFELAHELQPDEARWANNAGFFLRDAAYDMELKGRRLCRAAHGKITDAEALAELRELAGIEAGRFGAEQERALFSAAANRRIEEARATMERSWEAYRAAAELAPDDVRIVNDTALVLVYYLGRDLDQAEQYLLRCLVMGERQVAEYEERLASEDLTPEERDDLESSLRDLTEAWGDAYQNLGVLELVYEEDMAAAAHYFERSVEIGPDPRPDLTNILLPLVRGKREEPVPNELIPIDGWAKPCDG